MTSATLNTVFKSLEDELKSRLGIGGIIHPGDKGDLSEKAWLDLFQAYLPRRYSAEKATVVDSLGHLSDQIDIVIFDNHFTPFLFNKSGIRYIPAESVYAVFEVKQALDSDSVQYAIEKAVSVRRLHRTSTEINNAGINQSPKAHSNIISGLLCTKCEWVNGPTKLREYLIGKDGQCNLDLGCVINNWAFTTIHENGGSNVVVYENQSVILYLFLDLLERLQRVGTVPAIDLSAYRNNL